MPRVRIPIIGGHNKDRSLNINAQETVNFYPVLGGSGSKTVLALMGTAGLKDFADLAASIEVRNTLVLGSTMYVIAGDTFYSVNTAGAVTTITAGVLSTTTGSVYMAHDGANIMVVDPGVDGYTYNGAGNLTVIADADFPTPSSLTWQDGYFIVSEESSGKFFISGLYDPTAWDALDYATAEADPDNLKRIFMDNLNLWQFGGKTTEVGYNSGAADFPFSRYGNLLLNHGTAAPDSVASGDNGLFWLTEKRQVVRADGFSPVIVSTRQLEHAMAGYSSVSDAKGWCYTLEGHTFYHIVFPAANASWEYNVETKLWHQRRSYPVYADGSERRHRANCYAWFNGKHMVGDYQNGKIYEWDMDTYTDNSEVIRRYRVTQATHADGKNIFFHRFDLEMEAGTGLISGGTAWAGATNYALGDRVVPTVANGCVYEVTTDGGSSGASEPAWPITAGDTVTDGDLTWTCQGAIPQAVLSWSDDGGHTYGNEHWGGFGALGQYSVRTFFNRLGRSRDRRFKISVTGLAKSVILGAFMDLEIGSS